MRNCHSVSISACFRREQYFVGESLFSLSVLYKPFIKYLLKGYIFYKTQISRKAKLPKYTARCAMLWFGWAFHPTHRPQRPVRQRTLSPAGHQVRAHCSQTEMHPQGAQTTSHPWAPRHTFSTGSCLSSTKWSWRNAERCPRGLTVEYVEGKLETCRINLLLIWVLCRCLYYSDSSEMWFRLLDFVSMVTKN